MDDKLLDKLLGMLEQRFPSWSRIAAELRINGVTHVRGVKPGHQTSKELALRIELLDMDRKIAKLSKPKAKPKAKKVTVTKAKKKATATA
jgi:hypothetical protein